MPRESVQNRKKRVGKIIRKLKGKFPDARCALDHKGPLELMVATILSAQCTDVRVNIVTKDLFKKYRKASDYAGAQLPALEKDVQSTGFFRNKAKNIKSACTDIVDKHSSKVPDSMESLTGLAGIGRKTANVILGNAFGKNEGVVVDTHVGRIANRLALTRHHNKNAEKIEQDLMELVLRKEWMIFSHLLILHGRATCKARKPACDQCTISNHCPAMGKV